MVQLNAELLFQEVKEKEKWSNPRLFAIFEVHRAYNDKVPFKSRKFMTYLPINTYDLHMGGIYVTNVRKLSKLPPNPEYPEQGYWGEGVSIEGEYEPTFQEDTESERFEDFFSADPEKEKKKKKPKEDKGQAKLEE